MKRNITEEKELEMTYDSSIPTGYDKRIPEVQNYEKILEQTRNQDPKKHKDRERQINNLGQLMDRISKENTSLPLGRRRRSRSELER